MAKRKNKKKKILYIALIICILILTVLVVILNKEKEKQIQQEKEQQYQESIKEFQEFSAKFEAETILPRKMYELYKYNGSYENADLFRNMKVFANYLDYLQKNVTLADSEDFYKQNGDDVKSILGITEYEKFKVFIEKLESYNIKFEDFKYAEFVVGSSHILDGYFVFDINFYYGEIPDKVTFTVHFANSKTKEIAFKYEFQAEEIKN